MKQATERSIALRLQTLAQVLAEQPNVQFAVLIGSQVNGTARPDSDWDIAIAWQPGLDWLENLAETEMLRKQLAISINVTDKQIDLIDIRVASLAMRRTIADDGLCLKGGETLAWARFLTRTWREIEDFYWEKDHAA